MRLDDLGGARTTLETARRQSRGSVFALQPHLMWPASSSGGANNGGINGQNSGIGRSYSLEEPGPEAAARRPSSETINIFGVEYPVTGRAAVSTPASTSASRTSTLESGRPGHQDLLDAVAAVREEGPPLGTDERFSREPTRQELSQAVQSSVGMTRSSSAGGLPTTDANGLPIIRRTSGS